MLFFKFWLKLNRNCPKNVTAKLPHNILRYQRYPEDQHRKKYDTVYEEIDNPINGNFFRRSKQIRI